MLENVKIGDKVWSPIYGWGKVVDIHGTVTRPMWVKFGKHYEYYLLDGMNDGRQVLFWDEIDMTPPPKPKREVTVDFYINIYLDDRASLYKIYGYIYKTPEKADELAGANRLGEAVHIKHTYTEKD